MARRRWVVKKLVCCDPICEWEGEELVEDGHVGTCGACQGPTRRPDPPAALSATVHDDVLWGGPQEVHNIAEQPIFIETKSEYRRQLKLHGMREKVRHVPVPGTDKSPITSSWDIGLPPGFDPRPFCMLSPEEQRARREEAATRLEMSVDELAALSRDLPTLPESRDPYGNLTANYERINIPPAEADRIIGEFQDASRGRR